MKLIDPTLIMLVGPPGTGKSTLAGIIHPQLGVRHWDIDEIRELFFGKAVSNDGTDAAIKARDDAEMAGTYNILLGVIDGYLRAGHSLMLTCTLSSKKWGQDRVKVICERYPQARIRIVLLWPEIALEDLRARFAGRAQSGYIGATTDPDRAWELRNKYDHIELPHLTLDTGPAHTPQACAAEAVRYILDVQFHDPHIPGN